MIDSVAVTWGCSLGTLTRLVRGEAEPVSEPVHLDIEDLHARYASHGQLTTKRYEKAGSFVGGNYKLGDVQILYSPGRLEARASLPKIITGDLNDVVLDQGAVHHALEELTERVVHIVDRPLKLREAVPTRIDYVIQWEVPSVAMVLEVLKSGFTPKRAVRSEDVSPKGGRTLSFGKGGRRMLRFYDKGAEVAERRCKELGHGIPQEEFADIPEHLRRAAIAAGRQRVREEAWANAKVDTILRFEVQDRRPARVRSIHELGWRACDVRAELERALDGLATASRRDFAYMLDQLDGHQHQVAYALAPLHLVEHPELLPVIRTKISQRSYYAWRRRMREATLAVADWAPTISPVAFDGESTLWRQAA